MGIKTEVDTKISNEILVDYMLSWPRPQRNYISCDCITG